MPSYPLVPVMVLLLMVGLNLITALVSCPTAASVTSIALPSGPVIVLFRMVGLKVMFAPLLYRLVT